MKTNLILGCLVTLAAGCASPITKQDQASLAQPINCSTAEGDLRVLQSEKARFEVGTGKYNQMIDDKMAKIKGECGL